MNRIRGHGRGWVFTSKDFLDFSSRNNVAAALRSLAKAGHVRHFARGLYDYPRRHPELGDFPPHATRAAEAVARITGDRIYPTGAQAANMLGLTTQVPARTAYVTTGKPQDVVFFKSGFRIELGKAKLPKTVTRYRALLALQALDNIGPDYVDQAMIDKCAKHLTPADKKDIHVNLRYIQNPWLASIARQLIA